MLANLFCKTTASFPERGNDETFRREREMQPLCCAKQGLATLINNFTGITEGPGNKVPNIIDIPGLANIGCRNNAVQLIAKISPGEGYRLQTPRKYRALRNACSRHSPVSRKDARSKMHLRA